MNSLNNIIIVAAKSKGFTSEVKLLLVIIQRNAQYEIGKDIYLSL